MPVKSLFHAAGEMIWLARVYKAWSVNVDHENKIDIIVQEPKEHEVNDVPEGPDTEALVADAEEKARSSARGIMDNAVKESGSILSNARAEAERLKKEAELAIDQERAAVLLEAEKRGYEEGYSKGEAAANAIIDEANNLKEDTFAQREEAIKRLEPELVELIIRIVGKLVAGSKARPQVVLHLIRQGLAQSNFTGDITLRVSKEDYDNVVSNKEVLLESVEGGADLVILKDFSLSLGDCVIETPFGVIDSSLDMQFEEIRENLKLILEGD